MKTVIVTQARMGSSRLPGKVALKIQGVSLLGWHLERLKHCAAADEVVVATTVSPADEAILKIAAEHGVRWFRGSEDDVLSRYHGAARETHADLVVRVTSDCPLWDPVEGENVIDLVKRNPQADLANNCEPRTFPRGLDTEAFWMDVLERMQRAAPPAPCPQREHVSEMAYGAQSGLFVKLNHAALADNSDLRWCVDTREDFSVIEKLIAGTGNPLAAYPLMLAYARAHPEIGAINAEVVQKTV